VFTFIFEIYSIPPSSFIDMLGRNDQLNLSLRLVFGIYFIPPSSFIDMLGWNDQLNLSSRLATFSPTYSEYDSH
jgi:hypothetical protein